MRTICFPEEFLPLNQHAEQSQRYSRITRVFFSIFCIIGITTFIFIEITNNLAVKVDNTKEQQYQVLVQWMKKAGARINGVEGKSMFAGGGRGLYATKDLNLKENAFSIPSLLWISDRNAKKKSAISYLYASDDLVRRYMDSSGDSWGLILMLEYEKYNPFSFWKPYTDFIPNPASVIGWEHDEIEEMQSDVIRLKVSEHQQYVRKSYDELMVHLIRKYPKMFSSEKNSFRSFLASTITGWSRSFDTSSDSSKSKERSLVPLGDLLNHKTGVPSDHWTLTYNTDDCDPSEPLTFEFHAPQAKRAGEEIHISYSDTRPTTSWVLWGGFVPTDSLYGDYITLQIKDDLFQLPEPRVDRVTWVGPNGHISEDFLEYYMKCKYHPQTEDFTDEMWRNGFESLLKGVEEFESTLPTSLESDLSELKKKGIDFKRFQALTYRSRVKQIFQNIKINLRHRATTLDKKWFTDEVDSIVSLFEQSPADWSNKDKINAAMITLSVKDPNTNRNQNV